MGRYGKPVLIAELGEPRPHPARDRLLGTPEGCEQCGKKHLKCAGHKKHAPDMPCNQQAMRGQRICWRHGGKSPQALTTAKRRILKAEGIHDLQCLGYTIGPTTPVTGIEAMLNEAERNVVNLRIKVASLANLVVTETDKLGARKLATHPLWVMYCDERDRYAALCIACEKLGFDKARLRIEQQQATQLAQVIDGVLTRAGLDPKAIDVRSWVLAEIEATEAA